MSLIDISHVTFGYEGRGETVLEDVSIQLDTSWRTGLIGRNGRGKTTLLRLLMGEYPHQGTISAPVPFAYFPGPAADPEASAETCARAENRELERWELERELNLLEVGEEVLDRPFRTLSGGEQTKVMLAAMFAGGERFLLLDEPTNHLDQQSRALVGRFLKRKKGFLLVSHDRDLLDACTDHTISMERTGVRVYRGSFSIWEENKQRQEALEEAQRERLNGEIKRLQSAAQQTAHWSDQVEASKKGSRNSGLRPDRGFLGHKAAKMMKRSKQIEDRRQTAVEEKAKLLRNVETAEDLKLRFTPASGKLLDLLDVAPVYNERPVCRPVRLELNAGERAALTGGNGCGKTSLLRLICGEPINHTGSLWKKSGLTISYLPQDTSFLRGTLEDFIRESEIDGSLFRAILRKLGFERAQFEGDLKGFSGGQKKKVVLARSLCQPAQLYLWDEPLNFIDVLSRMQIEQLLLRSSPTLLFVEHDQAFCRAVATKSISLLRDGSSGPESQP